HAAPATDPLPLHDALPISEGDEDGTPRRGQHPARMPVRPHRDCDDEGEPEQPGPQGERVGEPHQLARIRPPAEGAVVPDDRLAVDRKSTRLNSSHVKISYA